MNWFDRAVVALAPEAGLRRLRAKRAAEALMHYNIATPSKRTAGLYPSGADADAAASRRWRVSAVVRDLVRNTGTARRAVSVIAENVVGDGIMPSLAGGRRGLATRFDELAAAHLDTTAIDADGALNLYGLQALIMSAVVADGEVLVRVRRRRPEDGLPLPFQRQVLEADYIDASADLTEPAGGGVIRDGIRYDALGRRVAYRLFYEHPGSTVIGGVASRWVPASEIIHVFRRDRPGQQRGVSWLAPVAEDIADVGDYMSAQLMRQKIAACFAAFRLQPDGPSEKAAAQISALSPGAVAQLGPGEDIKFAEPPRVDGLDQWMRAALRQIATGLGISYEALSADLSGVNFSSARMGRLEMDRNVSGWQSRMMIPQCLDPVGRVMLEAWSAIEPTRDLRRVRVKWTPPARTIVDPTKEIPAMRDAVRAGLRSWQATVRMLGEDPEVVAAEMADDAALFDRLGLQVESDARVGKAGAPAAAPAAAPDDEDGGSADG